MPVFALYQRVEIEGLMPERALLRLRRAGIDLFYVQKTEKNRIVFCVKKKDVEKVFAIYPKVCYNKDRHSAYVARSLGGVGSEKYLAFAKNRMGLVLGGLLFCVCVLAANAMTFGVEFVGSDVYAREAMTALEEQGVKPFSFYRRGNEDLVCAKLLSLDGVEFCSVKKAGLYVRVEMRLGRTGKTEIVSGDMKAKHEGTLVSLTVLRGTALKKAGDRVNAGETLVGGWFTLEGGEQVSVQPIARASIACTYEGVWAAADQESAFAAAYLQLGLSENERVTERNVSESEEGYLVKIAYTAVEQINL